MSEKNLKVYYTIKDVAEIVGVTEPTLRFWETEFPHIKPKTTANKVRQYTMKEIDDIKVIYNLIRVRGFKIAAARTILTKNRKGVDTNAEVLERLMSIRTELQALKKQLDYMQ